MASLILRETSARPLSTNRSHVSRSEGSVGIGAAGGKPTCEMRRLRQRNASRGFVRRRSCLPFAQKSGLAASSFVPGRTERGVRPTTACSSAC